MRRFGWRFLASIGDAAFYRWVIHTARLREAVWFYLQLMSYAAVILALAAAVTVPSYLADQGNAWRQALAELAPDAYTLSLSPDGTLSTTLPEPFVMPGETLRGYSADVGPRTHALVVDTSTSTASSTEATPSETLTEMNTFALATRSHIYLVAGDGEASVTESYAYETFATEGTLTGERIAELLAWPGAHPLRTAALAFFGVGIAATAAGILLLGPIALAAALVYAGLLIRAPHVATYLLALRASLFAATLPILAVVLFSILPLPPFSLSIFLLLLVFFALFNLTKALREENSEGDMHAEK